MKKLFIFLSAVVLTTSMNLMGAAQEPAPMEVDAVTDAGPDFGFLPWPAKRIISAYLSDNPIFVYKVSLLCHGFYDGSTGFRQLVRDTDPALDLAQLHSSRLNDFKIVLARYKILFDARKDYFNFRQDEFVNLQEFMMCALCIELVKPEDQINYNEYVVIPLALKVGFESIEKKKSGATPLYAAASAGSLFAVGAFVAAGADVNHALINDGMTALHIASQEGHFPVVQFLLKIKNINVNKRCIGDGTTPLFLASHWGNTAVVEALVGVNEIDLNLADANDRSTPLYNAANFGYFDIVRLLLRAGADYEKPCITRGAYGMTYSKTPLYIAASNGFDRIVEILLIKGANFETKCCGCSVLSIAKVNNRIAVVHLLEEAIASRNSRKRSAQEYSAEESVAKRQRR